MLDYLRIMLDARLAKMDERGASAVEYGLLIAGIAALIVVVVFAFGGVIKNIFSNTCKSVGKSAAGGAAAADSQLPRRGRGPDRSAAFSCPELLSSPGDRGHTGVDRTPAYRPSSAEWLVPSDHTTSGDRLYLREVTTPHTEVITAPAFKEPPPCSTTCASCSTMRDVLDEPLLLLEEPGALAGERLHRFCASTRAVAHATPSRGTSRT